MEMRSKIIKHWLCGKRHRVTFYELLKELLRKNPEARAKKVIENIKDNGEFLAIKLKNFDRTLYWPKCDSPYFWTVFKEICYKHDWHYYEKPHTKVRKDDVVLDCGAAEGLFSLTIENRCKKVYAIEPLPLFANALHKTFHNSKNVEIIQCALSNQEGVSFITNEDVSSRIVEKSNIQVKLSTVDKLFFEKDIPVNYIKADLEGSEPEMMQGAVKTITKYKPRIAITTYHKKNDANDIYKIIKSIDSKYNIEVIGIKPENGAAIMMHAWI